MGIQNLAWPNRWFGIFRDEADDNIEYPLLKDFQDASWSPDDKSLLVSYLEQGPNVIAASAGQMECEICGCSLPLGSYRSDGVWLWPEGLEHYVRSHSLRLPEEFANWIRSQGYAPPKSCDVPVEELPWP